MLAQRNFLLIKLATAIVIFNLLVVCIILASAEKLEDQNRRDPKLDSNLDSSLLNDWQIDSQFAEPRQYFKINVAPKKIQRSRQATELINRRAIPNSDGSAISQTQDQQKPSSIVPNNTVSKQKISKATLKKLLNQSLLNRSSPSPTTNLNSSSPSSNGSSKSNFKFAFIQRATAAPYSIKQNSQSLSHQHTSSTQQPSLAASVSRQLASSLLKSAAEIVSDNLDSAKPSLSALASQLAASQNAAANSILDAGSNINNSDHEQKQASPDNDAITKKDVQNIDGQKSSPPSKSVTKGKIKQPSKIYNLPVKFVSNGQPNHVVLSTIRQHFASIRKMQQAAAQSANNRISTSLSNQGASNSENNQQQSKRRKPQQYQKFKSNSRLIYLPLKYLSNARPSKIITTSGNKSVSHKSSFQSST